MILNSTETPRFKSKHLYVLNEQYDEACTDEDDKIKQKGQIVAQDLYYMKQLIHNACGTVGVIHSLANNIEA